MEIMVMVKEALDGPEKKMACGAILQRLLFPDNLYLWWYMFDIFVACSCLGEISAEQLQ